MSKEEDLRSYIPLSLERRLKDVSGWTIMNLKIDLLWRNVSMEIHRTSLSVSSDHFIIVVNITFLEKSLIVCTEPGSRLLMTLPGVPVTAEPHPL